MFKVYNLSQNENSHKLELDLKVFKFPAGEVHFNLDTSLVVDNALHITTDLSNSDEIIQLMLFADAFRHKDKYLELLYTPYARQDRRTSHGEPFSLRAFAKMINSCGFKRVTVYDPHSDVTAALIDNIFVIKRVDLVIKNDVFAAGSYGNSIIISPDVGALKANQPIAQHYKIPHISATKIRDVETGEITATKIHTDIDLMGKDLFILDDICDGGRTFVELAKVLKGHKPKTLNLYCTVSISEKGRHAVRQYYDTMTFNHELGE